MVEIWDAYLADGQKTDQQLIRGQAIPNSYFHLVVEAIIKYDDGDFLLLQRASGNPSFPNYWEFSCGGSALKGETAEQAIKREIKEETGLTNLKLVSYDTYLDEQHQCLFQIFLATTAADKQQLRLQKDEVAQAVWVPVNQLNNFIHQNTLIPSHKMRARKILTDH